MNNDTQHEVISEMMEDLIIPCHTTETTENGDEAEFQVSIQVICVSSSNDSEWFWNPTHKKLPNKMQWIGPFPSADHSLCNAMRVFDVMPDCSMEAYKAIGKGKVTGEGEQA